MKVEKIVHERVRRDGTFEDEAGSVEVDGIVSFEPHGGCPADGCQCSEQPYLSVIMPRDSWGKVEVMRVTFDSPEEARKFATEAGNFYPNY